MKDLMHVGSPHAPGYVDRSIAPGRSPLTARLPSSRAPRALVADPWGAVEERDEMASGGIEELSDDELAHPQARRAHEFIAGFSLSSAMYDDDRHRRKPATTLRR